MRIYLVRHTEYYNPQNVYPFLLPVYLSEKGRKDAKIIASWFADKKVRDFPIFCSPMVRCVQTAEILSSSNNSFVTIDDRLRETTCPNMQGKPKPVLDEWKFEEDDSSRESKQSLHIRTSSIWNEKVADGRDCIFVSHGDPLTVLYYHLLRKTLPHYLWDPQNDENTVQKGDIVEVKIENDSVQDVKKITVI